MAGNSGSSYLQRLAKNRLKNGGQLANRSMRKKKFPHSARTNAHLNTRPDTPMRGAHNSGNRGTGMGKSVGGNISRGPKKFIRAGTLPKNRNVMRGVS